MTCSRECSTPGRITLHNHNAQARKTSQDERAIRSSRWRQSATAARALARPGLIARALPAASSACRKAVSGLGSSYRWAFLKT